MRNSPAITLLGSTQQTSRGLARRTLLQAGGLSLLGGALGGASSRAKENPAKSYRSARAKSVVLIYLQGGPPTQDMFDLKPNAPDGIRSEFKPIATSAPGVHVCELL